MIVEIDLNGCGWPLVVRLMNRKCLALSVDATTSRILLWIQTLSSILTLNSPSVFISLQLCMDKHLAAVAELMIVFFVCIRRQSR